MRSPVHPDLPVQIERGYLSAEAICGGEATAWQGLKSCIGGRPAVQSRETRVRGEMDETSAGRQTDCRECACPHFERLTTLNGESLGSRVDEERSQLR